jgi:hypothetical protein
MVNGQIGFSSLYLLYNVFILYLPHFIMFFYNFSFVALFGVFMKVN